LSQKRAMSGGFRTTIGAGRRRTWTLPAVGEDSWPPGVWREKARGHDAPPSECRGTPHRLAGSPRLQVNPRVSRQTAESILQC
jgi:hypothetical protein